MYHFNERFIKKFQSKYFDHHENNLFKTPLKCPDHFFKVIAVFDISSKVSCKFPQNVLLVSSKIFIARSIFKIFQAILKILPYFL